MINSTSENLNELFSALSKAQGQIRTAVKDSKNPYFKSEYTSLDGCWDAARQPLASNGLTIIQTLKEDGGKFLLVTVLGHSSGQYISSMMPLLLAKNDPQSFGSACTYARRYSLCALIGLTQGDDDDGEKAMKDYRETKFESKKVEQTFDKRPNEEEMTFEIFKNIFEEQHNFHFINSLMFEYIEHLKKEMSEKGKSVAEKNIMLQALQPARTQQFINGFRNWVERKQEIAEIQS